MTEEEKFREIIDEAVNTTVDQLGMQTYCQNDILNFLQRRAKEAGVEKLGDMPLEIVVVWNIKHQKTASPLFQGHAIITESVEKIVKTASIKAMSEKRAHLNLADVEYGFQIHFCTIYPFCSTQQ